MRAIIALKSVARKGYVWGVHLISYEITWMILAVAPILIYVQYIRSPGKKAAPSVFTDQNVAEKMLRVGDVTEKDTVYDLGSGDGRIPILAAKKYGAEGRGIEIDSSLVRKARKNVKEAGVQDQVVFKAGDFFKADVSEATVVSLFLWEEVNIKLRPMLLRQLEPGDRIVSNGFGMGEWKPDSTEGRVRLWIVPEDPPEKLLKTNGGS